MPDEQKAESEIVRPEPIHADKIKLAVMAYAHAATIMAEAPAQSFAMGFELALTIAVDNPDVVRDVLATIDNATNAGSAGAKARADSARLVAEAARGIEPRDTAAEIAEEIGIDLNGDDGPSFSWN